MPILAVGLKPNDAECADQTEQRADLKLPLPDHGAFLGKNCEREQGAEDDRRANENRVNAGAHVKQSDDLCDLVNDIRQAGNQAERDRADVDLGSATKLNKDKRNDCETGNQVAVKILRPRIVKAIEIKLKERRHRPDDDGREKGGVAFGQLFIALFHRG
jgi:hypothetical protein